MVRLDGVPRRGVGLGPLNSIERYEEISTQILGSAQLLHTSGTHGCTREVPGAAGDDASYEDDTRSNEEEDDKK